MARTVRTSVPLDWLEAKNARVRPASAAYVTGARDTHTEFTLYNVYAMCRFGATASVLVIGFRLLLLPDGCGEVGPVRLRALGVRLASDALRNKLYN